MEALAFVLDQLGAGFYAQPLLLTGARGTGKTVTLRRLEEVARDRGWVVVRPRADGDLRGSAARAVRWALAGLASRGRWEQRAARAAGVPASLSLSLGGLSLVAAPATDLLASLARAARSQERGVLLSVDDLQDCGTKDLAALLDAVTEVAGQGLPLTLLAAGLPRVLGSVGLARSYAERVFRVRTLACLGQADAWEAFTAPAAAVGVGVDEAARPMVVSLTDGHPYALQALGAAAWRRLDGDTLTYGAVSGARGEYHRLMSRGLYAVRLERLTPAQQDYLRAMAALPPYARTIDLVDKELGGGSGGVRGSLVRAGIIERPTPETVAFTVPGFDGFVREVLVRTSTSGDDSGSGE